MDIRRRIVSFAATAVLVPAIILLTAPPCGCNGPHDQSQPGKQSSTSPSVAGNETGGAESSTDDAATMASSGEGTAAKTTRGSSASEQAEETSEQTKPPVGKQSRIPRPTTQECGTITDEMIHQGEVLFSGKGNCSTCHKGDATGSALGPNLTDTTWLDIPGDFRSIAKNIRTGVELPIEHPTPMPPMGGARLTDEQICQLAAYIWSFRER